MRGFGPARLNRDAPTPLSHQANAMRYGHGEGPRGALCHLRDKSRSDSMHDRDDFAIRRLSRRNLAYYCEGSIRKLRVISDSDDFGDSTPLDRPVVTPGIARETARNRADEAPPTLLCDDR